MKQAKFFILSLTLLASASALAMDQAPNFGRQINSLKGQITRAQKRRVTKNFSQKTKNSKIQNLQHQLEIAQKRQEAFNLSNKPHTRQTQAKLLAAVGELAQLEETK